MCTFTRIVKLLMVAIEIMVIQIKVLKRIGRVSADKASIGKLFHSGMVTCVKEYKIFKASQWAKGILYSDGYYFEHNNGEATGIDGKAWWNNYYIHSLQYKKVHNDKK